MMYDRGVDTGSRDEVSRRLASLVMASLESCNSVEMKLTLIGALSASLPLTSVGLIWRLQCAELLYKAQSLSKAIELLQALQGDAGDLFR